MASLRDLGRLLASSFHIRVVVLRPAAGPLGCYPVRAGHPELSLLGIEPLELAFLLRDSPTQMGGGLGKSAAVCLPGKGSLKNSLRGLVRRCQSTEQDGTGPWEPSLGGDPSKGSTCTFPCCQQPFPLLLSLEDFVADFSASLPDLFSPLSSCYPLLLPSSYFPPTSVLHYSLLHLPSLLFSPLPSDSGQPSPLPVTQDPPGSEPPLASNHLVLELRRPFFSLLPS